MGDAGKEGHQTLRPAQACRLSILSAMSAKFRRFNLVEKCKYLSTRLREKLAVLRTPLTLINTPFVRPQTLKKSKKNPLIYLDVRFIYQSVEKLLEINFVIIKQFEYFIRGLGRLPVFCQPRA